MSLRVKALNHTEIRTMLVVTGRKTEDYALRSEYDAILKALQELPYGSDERNAYVAEKQGSTRAYTEVRIVFVFARCSF